jgi:hypothetical protein
MSAVSEDISKIRVYGVIPMGRILLALSQMSPDRFTRNAVYRMQDVSEKRGILQLDAHLGWFDIMASICSLAKVIPDLEYAAGLMTVKWSKFFLGKEFFRAINKSEHLTIQEVIRFEDIKHVSAQEYGKRKGTNLEVTDNYKNLIDRPHAIGNIAPYGSRKKFLQPERIRSNVIEMVREFPSVCSLAKPVLPGYFRLYLSPLIEPLGNIPEDNIRRHIQKSFAALQQKTV